MRREPNSLQGAVANHFCFQQTTYGTLWHIAHPSKGAIKPKSLRRHYVIGDLFFVLGY